MSHFDPNTLSISTPNSNSVGVMTDFGPAACTMHCLMVLCFSSDTVGKEFLTVSAIVVEPIFYWPQYCKIFSWVAVNIIFLFSNFISNDLCCSYHYALHFFIHIFSFSAYHFSFIMYLAIFLKQTTLTCPSTPTKNMKSLQCSWSFCFNLLAV